jgi:hypothetical protein
MRIRLTALIPFLCVISGAVFALPNDIQAKREPYPEFDLTGYDLSYCDPLPTPSRQGANTRIYWKNTLTDPVIVLWLWSDGTARFVHRILPDKGYYTAFKENHAMALIREGSNDCIFAGKIEAGDDGKRLDTSTLLIYSMTNK